MSEWTIGPGQSPAVRGPGHGVWPRGTGWQNYSIGFTFYLYDPCGVPDSDHWKVKAATPVKTSGDVF